MMICPAAACALLPCLARCNWRRDPIIEKPLTNTVPFSHSKISSFGGFARVSQWSDILASISPCQDRSDVAELRCTSDVLWSSRGHPQANGPQAGPQYGSNSHRVPAKKPESFSSHHAIQVWRAVTEVACDSGALRGLGTAFLRLGLRQPFRISRYAQIKRFECFGVGHIRMHNPAMLPWHNAMYATINTSKTSKTNSTSIKWISVYAMYIYIYMYILNILWADLLDLQSCVRQCEAWTWSGACLCSRIRKLLELPRNQKARPWKLNVDSIDSAQIQNAQDAEKAWTSL